MSGKRIAVTLAPIFGLAMTIGVPNVGMAGEEYKPKVKTETLIEEPLPGDDSRTVIIQELTVEPGYVGGRHYHTGPVYVYVVEGEFTVETEGRGAQTFKAGQLYKEPVGTPMLPRNTSGSDDLKLVIFQIGEKGKPMMIKAE